VQGTGVDVGGSGVEGMRVKPGSTVRTGVGGDAATVNVAVGNERVVVIGTGVGVAQAVRKSRTMINV